MTRSRVTRTSRERERSSRSRSAHLEEALLVAALGWSGRWCDRVVGERRRRGECGVVRHDIARDHPGNRIGDLGPRQRRLGADVIALAALVGALAVGEVLAGAIITLMLASGRAIEARAAARAQRDLGALVGRTPRTVQRLDGDILSEVPADAIIPGDLLLVRPGEVLAVDGRVEGGAAVLDESALTGESRQVERVAGDEVRSGVVNAGGPFEMRATSAAADSTYAAIVRLVEQSEASSAPFVRMADRYSAVFIVFGGLVAGLAWALSGDPVRAVAVLVVATPCPLILAAPIAVVAGLSRAARFGVIVKGGAVLEQLAKGEVLLFDKTGTLTSGQPAVVAVHATDAADEREVLRLAASLDQVSPHVLATAVVMCGTGPRTRVVAPVERRGDPGPRDTRCRRWRDGLGRQVVMAGGGARPTVGEVDPAAGRSRRSARHLRAGRCWSSRGDHDGGPHTARCCSRTAEASCRWCPSDGHGHG